MVEGPRVTDDADVLQIVEEDQCSKPATFIRLRLRQCFPEHSGIASLQLDPGVGEDAPDETRAVISSIVRSTLLPGQTEPAHNQFIDDLIHLDSQLMLILSNLLWRSREMAREQQQCHQYVFDRFEHCDPSVYADLQANNLADGIVAGTEIIEELG